MTRWEYTSKCLPADHSEEAFWTSKKPPLAWPPEPEAKPLAQGVAECERLVILWAERYYDDPDAVVLEYMENAVLSLRAARGAK